MPGTRFKPIASASALSAARSPARSVIPQIFTNGVRSWAAGSSGSRPAATNRAAAAAGSAERIRASPIRAASKPRARQPATVAGSRTPDSATTRRSSGTSSRSRTACSGSTARVRRSRLLRPISLARVASARSSSRSIVGLDKGLETQLKGLVDETAQAGGGMQAGQEQDRVRPGRPEQGQLAWIDHELLGQHWHADRGPDPAQVINRAAEPVRLTQDRDHRRATRRIGSSAGNRIVGRIDDLAGRRRRPLHLGDQGQAGPGQADRHVPRRRGRRRHVVRGRRTRLRRARPPGLRPAGRRSPGPRCERDGPGHADAPPRPAPAEPPRLRRPQPGQQLGRAAGVDRAGGEPDPAGQVGNPAGNDQRGGGIEEHDIAPDAGSSGQDRLDDCRVLLGRSTGQGRGRGLGQAQVAQNIRRRPSTP